MLNTGSLRDLIATSSKVKSEHQVIVEWNMNRYQKIDNYGIYSDTASITTYDPTDDSVFDGSNHIIYDDDFIVKSLTENYYSTVASVFEPDRPDPGIILLQRTTNGAISLNPTTEMSTLSMSSGSARYYPFMKNRPYDYFNSAKNLTTNIGITSGTSMANTGAIKSSNPFVVYEEVFPTNKIVIKVQNYQCVPQNYSIDILKESSSTTWSQIYSATSSAGFANGKLELYYNSGSWSTTVNRVTDLSQITSGSSQVAKILGIRFKVSKMTQVRTATRKYKGSLELIEMSPRLEADISDYTQSFSFNSSLGESEFGLPIGSLVTSNGNITLSNETNAFIAASALSQYKLLSPNVEFRFYQKITASVSGNSNSSSVYTIPLKTMYAESWSTSEDYTTSIPISDRFRLFQEKNVTDLSFMTNNGIPFSVLILTLLDNVGVTGYEFKKTNNSASADVSEDIRIKNFFCNKDQTLMEVLQDLAVATQSSMFIDAENKLNVITKERMAEIVSSSYSSTTNSLVGKTDFWFIGDEDFSGTGIEAGTSASYVSASYLANISSISESKIQPITSGDINYHTYGIRKKAGANLLEENIPQQYLEDVPAISAAIGSGFVYEGKILWEPGNDNDAVLGAANLIGPIASARLQDVFTQTFSAASKHDAIRQMFSLSSGSAGTASAYSSLVIRLDRNDVYLFPDYSGYVFLDGEFIEYYGKVFYAADGNRKGFRVFFSNEELSNYISNASLRSSMVPIGLIVKANFRVDEISNGLYSYKVIGDGRGALESKVRSHQPVIKLSDSDLSNSNRYHVSIGEKRNENLKKPKQLSMEIKYDFSQVRGFNALKKRLNIPALNYQTYLGHLKISGPKAPLVDMKAVSGASVNVESQNRTNRIIDRAVPGSGSLSFDDFVYFAGERNIHGVKIPLEFSPNRISTRMRLYSGKTTRNGTTNIASTLSSIAGIAFDVEPNGAGYYLEVESIGSGKDTVSPRAVNRNLRFYKLYYKKNQPDQGKLAPKILFLGAVNVQSVVNRDTQVTTDRNTPTDPVFELTIIVNRSAGAATYDIYYGDQKINKNPIIDIREDNMGLSRNTTIQKNIVMFVRNDSQAIYEYVAAAGIPKENKAFLNRSAITSRPSYIEFDDNISDALTGLIPVSMQNIVSNESKNSIYYFNDFAKIVRQAKKYEIRYESGPARLARLIDISKVNPQYMIKSQSYTPYGAELVVLNTSPGTIKLSSDSSLPLYIYGIGLEEISSGTVSLEELYEKEIEYKKRATDLSFNQAVNGTKSFSLDSKFIQSRDAARSLITWIADNCSRERMVLDIEVFANPILELGDKVKVISKDRGYYPENPSYGDKTFVVSNIDYSVSENGPTMKLKLIEVGEK